MLYSEKNENLPATPENFRHKQEIAIREEDCISNVQFYLQNQNINKQSHEKQTQMKYLIHIHPPQEFIQQIEEYRQNFGPQIQPQLNGYHITLMVSRFHSTEETSIIKDLEGICQTPFNVHADKMELFKKDTLVIKLSSEELKELHNKIIKSLAKYIDWANTEQYAGDPEREQVCKKYGSQFYAEFYQPHITVIEAEPAVFKQNLLNLNFFAGKTFRINEFYLSKKEKKWETVKKFQLTNPKSF